jgi:hypothetical protein
LKEWKLLYPTASEFVVVTGQSNPVVQSPHRIPILRNESLGGMLSYCYDFDSLVINPDDGRGHQIMARTCSSPGFRGHRVDFGIDRTKHNYAEIEKLAEFLPRTPTRTTIGYSVGGRAGSIRLLRYVAVPSLGQGSPFREFIFE